MKSTLDDILMGIVSTTGISCLIVVAVMSVLLERMKKDVKSVYNEG